MLPSDYVQRLIEASNKKYILIQEMFVLTKNQTNLIEEDSISEFEKLVDEKQDKINEINKIDEEFNVYFQRLKQVLKISSLDDLVNPDIKGVKQLKDVVSNIMSVLKEISNIEKLNSIKAEQLLKQFGEDITKLNLRKKANLGYQPDPMEKPPSYFIDKKN